MWPPAKTSMWRQRRPHPAGERLVGRVLLSGLSQTTRWASRERRAICSRQEVGVADLEPVRADDDDRSSGEPAHGRSRRGSASATRRSACRRPSRPPRPPPAAAPRRGRLRRAAASARVSRVPKQKASQRGSVAQRGVGEHQERARVVGHRAGDVEQQHEAAGRRRRSRQARSSGSPPVRKERLSVRRRSGAPARAGSPRRERRGGTASGIRAIKRAELRRARPVSSREKLFSRSTSTSLAERKLDLLRDDGRASEATRNGGRLGLPKKAPKTRS